MRGGDSEKDGRLGYTKIIMRSDNEPAILALKEVVRRESDVEIELE